MADIIINEYKLGLPEKYWKSEQIVYGKQSPPRKNQPSMKELMTWEESDSKIKSKLKNEDQIFVNEQSKLLKKIIQNKANPPQFIENLNYGNIEQSLQHQQQNIFKNESKKQQEKTQLQTQDKPKNVGKFTVPKPKVMEKKTELYLQRTRDLPNTSCCKLLGKPIFDAGYGSKNVNPASPQQFGNNFMLTFNVNPHSGQKQPQYQQTYLSALSSEKQQVNHYPVRKQKVEKKEIVSSPKKKIEIEINKKDSAKNIKPKPVRPKTTKEQGLKQPPPSLITPVQETQKQNKDSLRYYESTLVPDQQQIQNSSILSAELSPSQFRDKEKVIKTKNINKSIKKQLEEETLKQQNLIANEEKEIQKIKQKIQEAKQEPQINEDQIKAEQKQQEVNKLSKISNLKSKCNQCVTQKITNLNKYYQTQEDQEKQANQLLTLSYSLHPQDLHQVKSTLQNMSPMEINPKNFGSFEGKWLKRIPAAGQIRKQQQQLVNLTETFDFHQPYYSIHL